LKFVLAGKDLNRYPGFNGVFRNVVYSVSKGAFVNDLEGLKRVIADTEPLP